VRRDDRDGLRAYRFETLPADAVDVLVSTRRGGVSAGSYASLNVGLHVGDDPEAVLANRDRCFATYGLDLDRSVWCRQVHAAGVTVVGAGDAGRGARTEAGVVADTDALVTDVPELTLCVLMADCVPVVIHDPVHRVAGLAHAGWKGTVQRIASRTLAVMGDRWGTDPAEVVAAIGPSIAPGDYEVGAEVIEAASAAFGAQAERVLRRDGDGGGTARFDLWTANALDLEAAGVPAAAIEVAGISTAAALDDFYSHRFEATPDRPTGRFLTAVTLTGPGASAA
jgi:polyphenol oxidase